jgi:dTDP-4-dehydrorhamnose 3,5-epimerase-like enzyme
MIERLPSVSDVRGWLAEAFDANHLRQLTHGHVVVTQPGFVRGNHFHEHATEITIVCGPAVVRIDAARDGNVVEERVPSGAGVRVTVPPGAAHAFHAIGPEPMFLVSCRDTPFEANPDTFPHSV